MAAKLNSFKDIMGFSDGRLLLSLLCQCCFFQFFGEIAPLAEHTGSVFFYGFAGEQDFSAHFDPPFSSQSWGQGSEQSKLDVEMPIKLFLIPARGNSVRTVLI